MAKAIDKVIEKNIKDKTKNSALLTAKLAEIDCLYGDGNPYTQEAVIQKTRFYLNQSADAILNAGRCLILIKEHEPHGEFMHAIERIGLAPRVARRFMQATVKYMKPGLKKLAERLNKTKLLDLLAEDNEDLKAFAKGGTLAGLTLDEVEKMSPTELRKTLRKERKQNELNKESFNRTIQNKNNQINEITDQLVARSEITPDDLTDEQSSLLERHTTHAIAMTLPMEALIQEINEREDTPEHLREACNHSVARCMHALMGMATRQGLAIDMNELVAPSWAKAV